MTPRTTWKFTSAIAALTGLLQAAPSMAAAVTHYSSARTDSFIADANGQYLRYVYDSTGAAVQSVSSGSDTFYDYNANAGQYYSQRVTTSEFSAANLATGALKGSAYLKVDNTNGPARTPDGAGRAYYSRSESVFADQFSVFSGGNPYLWNQATPFTFSFNVSGTTSLPSGAPLPSTGSNRDRAMLNLGIYQVGAIDLMDQLNHIDWNALGFDLALQLFTRLNDEINAKKIDTTFWCLGDHITPASWGDWCNGHQVDLTAGPTTVSRTFNPNGDFEWLLVLDTDVASEFGVDNVVASMDFSHTVNMGFDGPAGATVYSASGLFPNTLLMPTGNSVPEPASALLVLVGCAATWSRRRPHGTAGRL